MKISRLNAIEQFVMSKGTVSIDTLCETFGVSKNTIRRDLNELETRGHILKVYGGVTTAGTPGAVPMPVRSGLNSVDKNTIGLLAAEQVEDGDTIFIDSGSTTLCMLRHLTGLRRVTVVTHSLGAMQEAAQFENLSLISLGGIYSRPTDSFVGLSTFEALSGLTVNKAFMGATGVSLTSGMTNTTFLEAEIKKGVVQRAEKIYLMADASKLDHTAIITFCPISSLTAFITDRAPTAEYISFCKEHDVTLLYPGTASLI